MIWPTFMVVVIICGFYSKFLIFPFFAPKKKHFQHYKSWSGHDSSIEFFFQIFPNYQGMCQCAAKPKNLFGSGPFRYICVSNPCAHPKKPLSPPKIFARYWVITWKMLSANAPMLYQFCVQNPSQNNICFWNFLLVTVNLVNALIAKLLNKLQSQIGGHKLVT